VSPFAWYVSASGTWFLAFGLQGVIVSTIVAMQLHGDSRAMAATQMAQQLPGFGLILLGGAIADRVDRRALLIALYLGAAGLVAALGLGVEADWLSLPVVIAYVLTMGTVSAFVMPSRDAMLSDLIVGNLMRAITMLTLIQFAMQALGSAFGVAGRYVGILPLIGLQMAVLLAGVPALARLPRPVRSPDAPRRALRFGELADGMREVVRSPVLGPVALLSVALGTFFIGPFQVVFPLLVRDYYKGDIAELSLLYTSFPIGTIAGSALILWRGGIRRKGAAQLIALAAGALCLGALGLGLPFWGALIATVAFGVGGAFFMNAGRALFQEHATSANRGRVLSVYTLTFMGASGVIGAPLAGWLNALLGPLGTFGACAAMMIAVVGTVAVASDVRKLV
jgi:MFS family permease